MNTPDEEISDESGPIARAQTDDGLLSPGMMVLGPPPGTREGSESDVEEEPAPRADSKRRE
jgi:hypothetical protein